MMELRAVRCLTESHPTSLSSSLVDLMSGKMVGGTKSATAFLCKAWRELMSALFMEYLFGSLLVY